VTARILPKSVPVFARDCAELATLLGRAMRDATRTGGARFSDDAWDVLESMEDLADEWRQGRQRSVAQTVDAGLTPLAHDGLTRPKVDTWLFLSEASRRLAMTKQAVWKRTRTVHPSLASRRDGGRILVSAADVDRLIAERVARDLAPKT
jgi:hypothetical protein